MARLVPQQTAFLRDVVELLEEAWSMGFTVTGGELYRSREQQGIYYATGLSTTMDSKHLVRMAIDLNFFLDKGTSLIASKEALQPLGDFWCSLDPRNEWGGNWPPSVIVDTAHFQRNPE